MPLIEFNEQAKYAQEAKKKELEDDYMQQVKAFQAFVENYHKTNETNGYVKYYKATYGTVVSSD